MTIIYEHGRAITSNDMTEDQFHIAILESDKDRMIDVMREAKAIISDLYSSRGEDEVTAEACRKAIDVLVREVGND